MTAILETGFHLPKNPDFFAFDEEVISVFDNMASRSIVGYAHAYQMVSYLMQRHQFGKWQQIWDMGTTTGHGIKAIRQGMGLYPYVSFHALDISQASVDRVKADCPWANVIAHDLMDGLPDQMRDVGAVLYGYTLQFISDKRLRKQLIAETYQRMAPGAVLIVLEKWRLPGALINEVAQDAYIQFRVNNGYSLDEIRAKTQALGNSMWVETPDFMRESMIEAGFDARDIHTLYQQLNFGGIVAFKQKAAQA